MLFCVCIFDAGQEVRWYPETGRGGGGVLIFVCYLGVGGGGGVGGKDDTKHPDKKHMFRWVRRLSAVMGVRFLRIRRQLLEWNVVGVCYKTG